MKKVRIILMSGLMITLMAVCPGKTVLADPLFSANQNSTLVSMNHPVPFNATVNAIITTAGDLPVLDVTVNGSGNATHMGRIGFHVDETLVFDQFFNGTAYQDITLTAANGDLLQVHTISNLTPISAGPLIFYEEGTGEITGGTGRFTGASGNIVLKAVVNTETWMAPITLTGTIMY